MRTTTLRRIPGATQRRSQKANHDLYDNFCSAQLAGPGAVTSVACGNHYPRPKDCTGLRDPNTLTLPWGYYHYAMPLAAPGSRVLIQGLAGREDLNDQEGLVVTPNVD